MQNRFSFLQKVIAMQLDPRDLDDLIAIRDFGTLSAAAKVRNVAVSTVSRRIEGLEASLKLQLIDRRADGVRLTDQGHMIAQVAEPIAEQLLRICRAAENLREGRTGTPIRVSATEFVISDILAPALKKLWETGADFPVHLQSQADVVSLAGRDADVAVRMSRPIGASLYARRLTELKLGFFSTEEYLGGRHPESIDLRTERLLIYDDSYGRLPELDWINRYGFGEAIAMRTGSTRALITAARASAGIALLPNVFAAKASALVEIPTPSPLPVRQPWLIVHRDLRKQRSVRLVQDWIASTFSELRLFR